MIDEKIEQKAIGVLKALSIDTIPIDLNKIGTHFDIFMTEAPSKDELSGLLLKSGEKTIIGVNSNHHESRKRFTVAHELGHYFLHKNEDTFLDEIENLEMLKFRHKSLPKSKEEKEANNFAAALLMPSVTLKKHFSSLKELLNIEDTIKLLSEKYKVSSEAMKYRLINLNLI